MLKNNSSKIILAIVLVVVSLLIIKIDYDRTLNKANSDSETKISIEITEGESVSQILETLGEKNLLSEKEKLYTKIYLKLTDLESQLQAGIYQLPAEFSIKEIVDALLSGRSEDIWVSIPEGLRKDEIADIVALELGSNFSKETFLALTTNTEFISTLGLPIQITNLEGFLFPDKYAFSVEATEEIVIQTLVENFTNKVTETYTYEDIVMASIVEREGYNGDDRPVIAGILLKRLEEGWLLQTDATLLYPVKDWKHTITQEDKDDDNPYNTYKKIGLPPTPISNPGLQSIRAVLNPSSSPYYYYIHDTDGNPHYATTLEQHNANVNTYLR